MEYSDKEIRDIQATFWDKGWRCGLLAGACFIIIVGIMLFVLIKY